MFNLLTTLKNMYSVDYIDSVEVINVSGKTFIIDKQDISKLTEKSKTVFSALAQQECLQNPVYVSVSDNGVILVD